jgi:hypothetical protein
MQQRTTNPLLAAVKWMGGWPYFIALLLVILVGLGWYFWDRGRTIPLPPQAQNVTQNLTSSTRNTVFIFNGSIEELRGFYQQELPTRGWRYCGTRAIERCTNLLHLNVGTDEQTDIYRMADDQTFSGPTIEIWPVTNARAELQVNIVETRGPSR